MTRIVLTLLLASASIMGFMVRLPRVFRYVDKELHFLFYFFAAALLTFLFARHSIIRHALIFISLSLFGICIEFAQEYSNTFFHRKIHGRFDVHDLYYNLCGLLAFSLLWLTFTFFRWAYRNVTH